ncbi:hypothetical protein [Sediminicoccus sp. KRV36]|uniref:hypothetical protein n=1 Tax=Sediminicoccus sp. KRV36 TaxID=3133721 RepID=UPI00200F900E|nr:hypothetical protein [Sediminicoccus rosea]UPY37374.1 hypothetical protein LHU95_01410 [Sediminicoccus rosea]
MALLLGAVLAGCGGPSPETPAAVEAAPLPAEPSSERGIILGARALGADPVGERARVVAQVLRVAQGGRGASGAGAMEVIIRLEAGGRDVALVQPAEAWLRPGQRVRLMPGASPTLARDSGGA